MDFAALTLLKIINKIEEKLLLELPILVLLKIEFSMKLHIYLHRKDKLGGAKIG